MFAACGGAAAIAADGARECGELAAGAARPHAVARRIGASLNAALGALEVVEALQAVLARLHLGEGDADGHGIPFVWTVLLLYRPLIPESCPADEKDKR